MLQKESEVLNLKKYWLTLLFFALAVACDAGMDYFNFQVEYNSGWWSLTDGTNDVWHWLKKLKWLFIVLAILRKEGITGASKLVWLVIYGTINLIIHETLYKILKNK